MIDQSTTHVSASAEQAAMRRAIELASLGQAPMGGNPRVGCVLLSPAGDVLAQANHEGAGRPHAEAAALALAGSAARGATAVVTLEPCAHVGRTAPCVAALISAGVTRVVFAQPDTSTAAQGGAAALRAAGVEVSGGVLAAEAAALNPEWTRSLALGRPFVTWKVAATLDGRVSARDGSSRWITGNEARADVHRLRASVDCVVVGTGTVLADDPHLTVRDRDARTTGTQPMRVVVGTRTVPEAARVLDAAAETIQLFSHDPAFVLQELDRLGKHHALLEGGPALSAAFVRAGLVDQVVLYLAPALFGAGRSLVGDLGLDSLEQALRLTITDVRAIGADIRITASFENIESEA